MVRRREFVTLMGGAATWSLAARAQELSRVRRVGVLFGTSESETELAPVSAFREAMGKLGWIEGRNLRIDLRFGEGDPARLRAYAGELVRLAPDVIFAGGNIAVRALQQETEVIPIVFVGAGAVAEGNTTVRNLTHPEGNLTGFANKDEAIEGKWVQLIKEMVPRLARVNFVYYDGINPSVVRGEIASVEAAAQTLGVGGRLFQPEI